MKLAKTISVLVSSILGETDEVALLQSRNVKLHQMPNGGFPGDQCVAAGDPHIKTFDMLGQEEACYGPMGDYVLMKTDQLFVHARFMGFQKDQGYAFVKGLAIGGSALGATIQIPVINTDCLSFNNTCLTRQFGSNRIPLENGDVLTIRKGPGPDLVNFNANTALADQSRPLTYFIELTKNGVVDLLIIVNQGIQQHVMISASAAALAGTTGLCGNDNQDPTDDHFNVDACPHKLPCEKGEFAVVNEECDKPREPPECEDDSDRVAFYKDICEKHYKSDAYAVTHFVKPGDNAAEWQIWNCITDCCGDRDTCPDLGNNGEWADCLIQGDPHIKTFDSPGINKNAYGPLDDFYLAHNGFINVQGRYGSDRSDNKAMLMGVAVSGAAVGNDVIYFPKGYERPPHIKSAVDGSITEWAPGQKRLKKILYTIRYEEQGKNLKFIFDKTKDAGKPTRLYVIVLTDAEGNKLGRVRVNKPHHKSQTALACHIRIRPEYLTGVSGQCGNLDGNPDNDQSKEEDMIPWGPATNLFYAEGQNPQLGEVPFHKECSKGQLAAAMECCSDEHGDTDQSFLDACAVDNCCGADAPCNPETQCKMED